MSVSAHGRDWFRRFVLPGFALKAVIIGGGYATGRKLAEFFGPSGAWGGLLGMLLAAGLWSVAAAITFAFARATNSLDYRSFFRQLLGRFWFAYEIAFVLLLVIMLAVFGAAAAGGRDMPLMGLPEIVGTLALVGLHRPVRSLSGPARSRPVVRVRFVSALRCLCALPDPGG
jgi:uncharacterized membrane protein YkvI